MSRRAARCLVACGLALLLAGAVGAQVNFPPNLPGPGDPQIPPPGPPLPPITLPTASIDAVTPSGCRPAGGSATLLGSGFGPAASGRRVALRTNAPVDHLEIAAWTEQSIGVTIPSSLVGMTVTIAIRTGQGTWISNDAVLDVCEGGNPISVQSVTVGQDPKAANAPVPSGRGEARAAEPPSGAPAGSTKVTPGFAPLSGEASPAPPEPTPSAPAARDWVVLYADMESAIRADEALRGQGFRALRRSRLDALGLVSTTFRRSEPMSRAEAERRLRGAGAPQSVAPNDDYRLLEGGSDPRGYPGRLLGWQRCGARARIGVIDTTVDPEHPALAGREVTVRSFLSSGQTAAPAHHGTAVAGLLLGREAPIEGVTPEARLWFAAVFGRDEEGGVTTATDVLARAVDWLVGEGLDAINMSLGGPPNESLSLVLTRAGERDALMVAAAGNDGPRAAPVHPAAHPAVIAVAAVDARLAPYRHGNRGDYIDLSAPGVDVWVAQPGADAFLSGTSYAAPFVAAAAAAGRGQESARAVRRRLLAEAQDLGDPGRDPVFGAGLLTPPSACRATAAR